MKNSQRKQRTNEDNVYSDVCKSLQNARIRKLLYKNSGAGEKGIDPLEDLFNLFEGAWPLQEHLLEEPPKAGWRAALKGLMDSYGRNILEFSHHRAVDHRGIEHIEENWKRKHKDEYARLLLEMLAGYALGEDYGKLKINILVVDNKPDEIFQYSQLLPPELGFAFWKYANYFRVKMKDGAEYTNQDFLTFENNLRGLKSSPLDKRTLSKLGVEGWDPFLNRAVKTQANLCGDIDLVLQDQYLSNADENQTPCPDGSRLAEHYIDVMPQALVFLMTGTDVAELAAIGETRFVDRAISKSKLAALPWYYYLAFTEILGAMLWDSWLAAVDENEKPRKIFSRWTLRRLLGSIRGWMNEPDILWHGQTCAELVDHSQPHISDMWKMANEILGARYPNNGEPFIDKKALTAEERILLALGIWTHDIGHRGDDERIDSASIREIHSSISEALLLSNREAFGLGWLDDLCTNDCQCRSKKKQDDKRFVRCLLPQKTSQKLCLLRLAGVVSKYHQSSAPLSHDKLPELITGLKPLHDYSRLGSRLENGRLEMDIESIKKWCDKNEDLDWIFRDIRSLDDYVDYSPDKIDLEKVTYLLRFLDAVHLHRCRAGSRIKIKTHEDYRNKRIAYCEKECKDILTVLQDSPQGSKAYINAYERYIALVSYKRQVLENQEFHLWRQELVEKREVKIENNKLYIIYYLRKATLGSRYWVGAIKEWENELRNYIDRLKMTGIKKKFIELKRKDGEYASWVKQFIDDVILSELKGQLSRDEKFPQKLGEILNKNKTYFRIDFPDDIPKIDPIDLSLNEIMELRLGN